MTRIDKKRIKIKNIDWDRLMNISYYLKINIWKYFETIPKRKNEEREDYIILETINKDTIYLLQLLKVDYIRLNLFSNSIKK